MILQIFRHVFAPALNIPIFGHGVEMAMSRQFGGLYRSWLKECPEPITHGASKTKARKHLTITFGISQISWISSFFIGTCYFESCLVTRFCAPNA